MPLTDTQLRQIKSAPDTRYKLSDSGGLYLLVQGAGRYWRYDYSHAGRRRTLALGVYPIVSLAMARRQRDEAKTLLVSGKDPSQAKKEKRQAAAAAADNTFEAAARAWLKRSAPLRKKVTDEKLSNWLELNVYPQLGSRPIAEITPREVLTVVRRIEDRGSIETAHRVMQLCGRIFRYGVAEGLTERDVTADLRGALSSVPKSHFAAITEPREFGALLRAIDGYRGHPMVSASLRLAPLVFTRPGELRTAEWAEIDLDAKEWRIPAEKMKMKVSHLVPLSRQACEILEEIKPVTGHSRYVFPSLRTRERPMSDNTLNAALRSLGYPGDVHTAHGFRASARTILDEVLGERVDLIEHQLAHAVRDANGRAYNRTSHLDTRRTMMQRWADYLSTLRATTTTASPRRRRALLVE